MADQEIKPFQFDLTETLFFHRNEGVSEMLGIGLDPEISIESHPDHVSVRGIIALTGEYLPTFVEDRSEVEDEEAIQSRYFKRVERDEEGVCEFTHHFPIDISIPHERIKNLADLTVSVDHFDYQIPDARKLELEATVQIDGLEYNRKQDEKEDADQTIEEEAEEELDLELEDERNIHFDFKVKDEDEREEGQKTKEPDVPEESEEPAVREKPEEPAVPKEPEEPAVPEEPEKAKSSDPIKESNEPEEESIVDEVEEDEKVVPLNLGKRNDSVEETDQREVVRADEVVEEIEDETETIEEESNDVTEDPEEEERVEQPTYLLGLFEQDQDEAERYSQMKMYIVQEHDSLEQIAEKYQVSLAKLQRANQLEETSVYQGQIIYVPH